MTIDTDHWSGRLAELAERHHVPGATLGILRMAADGGEDEVIEAAYGLLNLRTGVETTTDSLFQLGSISKVWTATLVMQLVDEGALQLDAPLTEVMPELRLGDPAVTAKLTMRHLLTHTSGIDGDIFTDTGRGDDCLEKYAAGLAGAAQNHPLEATCRIATPAIRWPAGSSRSSPAAPGTRRSRSGSSPRSGSPRP